MDAETKHDAAAVKAAFRGHPDTWTAKAVLAEEVKRLQGIIKTQREAGDLLATAAAHLWHGLTDPRVVVVTPQPEMYQVALRSIRSTERGWQEASK